ncbi:MAG: thioredoxin family protein [Fimbriiglobus sp.]
MLSFEWFQKALPYQAFLSEFGQGGDQARWDASRGKVTLAEGQVALLKQFTRRMPVLVLGGAWCGDCVAQCPIFEKFAEIAPCIEIRYLDRDVHAEAQQALQINGGNRVPVAVFFSEDGLEVARYGERTLTAYRKLMTGLISFEAPSETGSVVSDWFREFERAQWILRLSPRLRRLHGD